jgi:hypothetical protein
MLEKEKCFAGICLSETLSQAYKVMKKHRETGEIAKQIVEEEEDVKTKSD